MTDPLDIKDVDEAAERLESARRRGINYAEHCHGHGETASVECSDLHAVLASRAVLLKEVERLRADNELARKLLKRVEVRGAGGSWTNRDLSDWLCDYKDWMSGVLSPESYARGHSGCARRGFIPEFLDVPVACPQCREGLLRFAAKLLERVREDCRDCRSIRQGTIKAAAKRLGVDSVIVQAAREAGATCQKCTETHDEAVGLGIESRWLDNRAALSQGGK